MLSASSQTAERSPPAPVVFARRLTAVVATALAGVALAVVPGVANAQQLNSVAIGTDASANFLVLDVAGASTSQGAGVIQWYGTGGANQRWNFVQTGDATQEIVNQNSGMCLTTDGVAGDQLYQMRCLNSPLQQWRGTLPRSWSGFLNGSTLVNPYSGLGVDVAGGSGKAGTSIIGWSAKDSINQHFGYWQL
jgi:hypothetical protein